MLSGLEHTCVGLSACMCVGFLAPRTKATGFTVTSRLINISHRHYTELISSCRGIRKRRFWLAKYCTLASTSIILWITVTLKSPPLRFAGLAGLTVGFGGLNCGGSLSHQPPHVFFYHLPSFFSPGKVATRSSLERKINRLVIHKNVNATLAPLGTSVCAVWDHSGLSAWLWTYDKWPHCFSIVNTYCARYAHTHIYLRIYMKALALTHRSPAHMPTHMHRSGPVMCHGDRGQILCDVCGGYIAWEKDQRSHRGCRRANNNSLKYNSS